MAKDHTLAVKVAKGKLVSVTHTGGHVFSTDTGVGGAFEDENGFAFQHILDDDCLDAAREFSGWTLEHSREVRVAQAKAVLGVVPTAYASDDAYSAYLAAARSNYKTHAAEVHCDHGEF